MHAADSLDPFRSSLVLGRGRTLAEELREYTLQRKGDRLEVRLPGGDLVGEVDRSLGWAFARIVGGQRIDMIDDETLSAARRLSRRDRRLREARR